MLSEDASSFNQSLNGWDTSQVTDMSSMFCRASCFNQHLNKWDTSQVTDMSNMFEEASSFNQPLNGWDTSQVTNMSSMFHGAIIFQPTFEWMGYKPGGTDMFCMFCESYHHSTTLLNGWDTSHVTNMNCMFEGTPISDQYRSNPNLLMDWGWDTSQVELDDEDEDLYGYLCG